jgi:APA family basic amino acid/polyamine antiporter
MCSVGTLFAFLVSSVAVMVLRRKYPVTKRPFRCPAVYLVGTLSIVSCGYIMYNLSSMTWERFWIWSALGVALYFLYGRNHSREAAEQDKQA